MLGDGYGLSPQPGPASLRLMALVGEATSARLGLSRSIVLLAEPDSEPESALAEGERADAARATDAVERALDATEIRAELVAFDQRVDELLLVPMPATARS